MLFLGHSPRFPDAYPIPPSSEMPGPSGTRGFASRFRDAAFKKEMEAEGLLSHSEIKHPPSPPLESCVKSPPASFQKLTGLLADSLESNYSKDGKKKKKKAKRLNHFRGSVEHV